MIVESLKKSRTLHMYDFTFLGGVKEPYNLDLNAGDSIMFGEKQITIYIAPHEAFGNPDHTIPHEDFVVERCNLLFWKHTIREVPEMADQQAEVQRVMKEMTRPKQEFNPLEWTSPSNITS